MTSSGLQFPIVLNAVTVSLGGQIIPSGQAGIGSEQLSGEQYEIRPLEKPRAGLGQLYLRLR